MTPPTWPESITLRWIRANLKAPSLGMTMFLLGLNGIYFLPLIYQTPLYSEAPAGIFKYYVLSWALIVLGGVSEYRAAGFLLYRRHRLWIAIIGTAIVVMTSISLAKQEPAASIVYKSVPFYCLLTVPMIGMRARNWPWIIMILFLQAAVGVIHSLHAFVVLGATSRPNIVSLQGYVFFLQSAYMGNLLLILTPIITGRAMRVAAIVVFVVELLRALFFSHRLLWVLLPVQLLMLIFIAFRVRGVGVAFRRSAKVFAGVALLLLIALSISSSFNSVLGQAVEDFSKRAFEKGSFFQTVSENERWTENRVITAGMTPQDWLLGKGLAARWADPTLYGGEDRYMIHNTWLNSFYWGGILLFLAVAAPLLWAFRIFLASRSGFELCFAAYALYVYFMFPSYLITHPTPQWVLFCIAVGPCSLFRKPGAPHSGKTSRGISAARRENAVT